MKSAYQKIMIAAKNSKGVRLSAHECFLLSMDDAISTAAANDDENDAGVCNICGNQIGSYRDEIYPCENCSEVR